MSSTESSFIEKQKKLEYLRNELERPNNTYGLKPEDIKKKLATYRKAVELDRDNLEAWNQIGHLLVRTGELNEAEAAYEKIKILAQSQGNQQWLAIAYGNLGNVHQIRGNFVQAQSLFTLSLAILERTLGPDHPQVAITLNNLAQLYYVQGQLAQAEQLYKRSLAILERAFGPDHPYVARGANNIGMILKNKGDLEGALRYMEWALRIDEKVVGPDDPNVARDASNIGQILQDKGDLEGALRYSAAGP
jgi:tetratricopeptide (TPR) repeat protein